MKELMMRQFRIYSIEDGKKLYLDPEFEPTEDKAKAQLFNERLAILYSEDEEHGLIAEEISEAEKMAALGIPTLPGLS